METYSHIVSLGNRCATTHAIRRFFNHGEGYPFDWWITPFQGLIAVLERPDVDWLYDPAMLSLTDKRASVKHAPTSILFHHEFEREDGGGGPVLQSFLDQLETPRARTGKLLAKLLALDEPGNRVLFVREVGQHEPLTRALAKRFSRADWDLNVIPLTDPGPDFKAKHAGNQWQGDPDVWDRALAKLDVRLDNPSLKPFAWSSPTAESAMLPAV